MKNFFFADSAESKVMIFSNLPKPEINLRKSVLEKIIFNHFLKACRHED